MHNAKCRRSLVVAEPAIFIKDIAFVVGHKVMEFAAAFMLCFPFFESDVAPIRWAMEVEASVKRNKRTAWSIDQMDEDAARRRTFEKRRVIVCVEVSFRVIVRVVIFNFHRFEQKLLLKYCRILDTNVASVLRSFHVNV